MAGSLERLVWQRAGSVCEYCRIPQQWDVLPFEIDHIIAEQHGGSTVLSNLALACAADNKYKGPNIAGRDPISRRLVPMFHPRRHKWKYHFRWQGPLLIGRTPIGRVTVAVLHMNLPYRVQFRAALLATGVALDRDTP